MNRKYLTLAGGAALLGGLLAVLSGRVDSTAGATGIAALFQRAGEGLRALSLSGFFGNLAAWLIVFLLCALPTLLLAGGRKMGVGRRLYQALEAVSQAQNILNLNACIGYPDEDDEHLTKNSVQFHGHLGYEMVGKFHKCSYKFGRWYHMVWMEKIIGVHEDVPAPVIPFSQLGEETLEKLGIHNKNW